MFEQAGQASTSTRKTQAQPSTDEFRPHYEAGVSPFSALRPTPVKASSLSTSVSTLLTQFAARKGNGKWKHLPRAQVSKRLTELAADATKPEQAGLNACGPALAIHLFIKRKPEDFVRFAIDLYDSGTAKFGSLTVSGAGLFDSNPATMTWSPYSPPPLLDWMLFSALRRSKDLLLKFSGEPDDEMSAITTPGDMEDWLRDGIGYSSVDEQANVFFTKGLSHLQKLSPTPDRDIVLLLNVSNIEAKSTKMQQKRNVKKNSKSAGIGGKVQSAFPNHWVELEKPFDTSSSTNNKAVVWTWAQSGYVLESPPDVWKDNYYGAIICDI